jgi:hypothetical protein
MRNPIEGAPPWHADAVRRAYFQDFRATREQINGLPGFALYSGRERLRQSNSVFDAAVLEVLAAINTYRELLNIHTQPSRPTMSIFQDADLSLRRHILAATSAAMAIVQHSRALSGKISIPEYQSTVDSEFRESPLHTFIQKLRIYAFHHSVAPVEWSGHIEWHEHGTTERFSIHLAPETLLRWDRWNQLAEQYIKSHPDGIDVASLFRMYREKVHRFQDWFDSSFIEAAGPCLEDYLRCRSVLDGLRWQSAINFFLSRDQGSESLSPLDFRPLLSNEEFEELLGLVSQRSSQIARLLEMLNRYGACDTKMREKVLRALGMDGREKV